MLSVLIFAYGSGCACFLPASKPAIIGDILHMLPFAEPDSSDTGEGPQNRLDVCESLYKPINSSMLNHIISLVHLIVAYDGLP